MFHLGSVQELISSWASLSLSPCLCHWIMAAASKIFCSACGSFFFFFSWRGFFFLLEKIVQKSHPGALKVSHQLFQASLGSSLFPLSEGSWAEVCFPLPSFTAMLPFFTFRGWAPAQTCSIFFYLTFHLLLPWCFKSFEMTASVLDITWPSLTGLLWKLVFDKPGLSDPNFWNCDSEMKLNLGAGWGIVQKAF